MWEKKIMYIKYKNNKEKLYVLGIVEWLIMVIKVVD
jgi:hypothetical protein